MNIQLVCIGKLGETYLVSALAEYEKRLKRFCRFSVCELKEERLPDHASAAQEAAVREAEGKAILEKIGKDAVVIALEIEGRAFSSEELAAHMESLALSGKSRVDFIIGGSLGLSTAVLRRADLRLSFSRMTFPHQLMRIILAEQIYRSFKINNNEPYHK